MSDIVGMLRRAASRPSCSMPETAAEAAEVIADLREQVEKLAKERADYKTNFFELSRAFNNQELQLAAIADELGNSK